MNVTRSIRSLFRNLTVGVLLTSNHGVAEAPPLKTAPVVDLARYMGTWYEIASFPNYFQRGCVATEVKYTLGKDGEVQVYNACHKESFDGEISSITGRAWLPEASSPGKLKVSFFWPMSADYWILEVDPNYQYAVVGEPDREKLWILSRTRQMDEAVYQRLVQNAVQQGYDVSELARCLQPKQ